MNGVFSNIDNRIAEEEVTFLRSSGLVLLVEITDEEGNVFMGYEWEFPLYVSTLSSIVP